MNGDSNNNCYIIPKKSKLVDEDMQKKGKKNKRNKQKNQQDIQDQIKEAQEKIQQERQRKHAAKQYLSKKQQLEIDNLRIQQFQKLNKNIKKMTNMFPDHLPSTLQRVYKQHNSNIQQSILYIAQHVPPDAVCNTLSKEKQQQANNLLAQLANLDQYSQSLAINGNEFQQLFQEISQMIKEDQQEKGLGVFDLNDLIDECESAKKAVVVGLKEVFSGQENMYETLNLDQNSLIVQQTEQFLYDVLKKAAQQSQRRDQDFPTMESTGKHKNMGTIKNGKNIIQRIKIQSKEERLKGQKTNFQPQGTSIFIPHEFKKSEQHGIYNIDNSYQSEAAMKQLAKQYNNVSLDILRFIYKRFDGDFNMCKTFLQKYYKDYRTETIIHVEKKNQKKNPYLSSQTKRKKSYDQIQNLDSNLMKMSLIEIRQQMEHLFKLRRAFKMTKANITNSKNRQWLERLSNQNLPLLKKMSDASRYKLIEQMRYSDPLRVDLHGYRVDQVDAIMESALAMIRQEYKQSNARILSAIKRKNEVTFTVITGKGTHSQYGVSVLKPAVQEWCNTKGIKSYLEEGSVQVLVLL